MRKLILLISVILIFGCKKEKVEPVDDGKRTIYVESYCQDTEYLIRINKNLFSAYRNSYFNNTSTLSIGDTFKLWITPIYDNDTANINLTIKQGADVKYSFSGNVLFNPTYKEYNPTIQFLVK